MEKQNTSAQGAIIRLKFDSKFLKNLILNELNRESWSIFLQVDVTDKIVNLSESIDMACQSQIYALANLAHLSFYPAPSTLSAFS